MPSCPTAARRDGQHPGGEPVNAGKSPPVAAKAAAIDAAQARPLTWKTVVKRPLAVAVAGAALYLALPKLIAVLLAYAAAGIVALFPLTPGGLGIVEASLSGLLILAGVRAGYAVLAVLAYRIASYWLPLLAGPPAYLLFRHRYGRPVPRRATPGEADSTA